MKKLLIFYFVVVLSNSCLAGENLEGTFELAGPIESNGRLTHGKSHLYFNLTGDSAKILYDLLEGSPVKDACTGYMHKGQANIACYETTPNKIYACGFSVNLLKNRTEAGEVGVC